MYCETGQAMLPRPCFTVQSIIKHVFSSVQTNEIPKTMHKKHVYFHSFYHICLQLIAITVMCKLTFRSHNSEAKSAYTQAHQPDTTYPHLTDQTLAPAFTHLNPDQTFYFSSSFVKCDSQGYTW